MIFSTCCVGTLSQSAQRAALTQLYRGLSILGNSGIILAYSAGDQPTIAAFGSSDSRWISDSLPAAMYVNAETTRGEYLNLLKITFGSIQRAGVSASLDGAATGGGDSAGTGLTGGAAAWEGGFVGCGVRFAGLGLAVAVGEFVWESDFGSFCSAGD